MKDVMPSVAMALIMFAAVSLLGRLSLSPLPMLVVQIAAGVAVYGGMALIFRPESARYLLETGADILRKKRGQ